MIIQASDKSDSKAPTVRSAASEAPLDEPPSPPPYTPTVASSDDLYHTATHPSNSPPQSFTIPATTTFNPNTPPAPRADLPPRCNHLIQRKTNGSISGTWHIDTALDIPERLLPPPSQFDGPWNQDAQKARKEREKEIKRHERERGGRPPLLPIVEVRPNLMLASTNGSIKGDVHIVSSDGLTRQTLIVAQGTNGAMNLNIRAPPEQPVRVYATSTNGSVSVRIPSSFEGAVTMSTTWGSVKISDAIKAKLTTFSSTSNTSRCFVGDWQALGFGNTPQSTDPNDDPPLPSIEGVSTDPFVDWPGPLVHISSTNGTVSLSYVDEVTTSAVAGGFTGMFRSLMSGLFGGGGGGGGGGSDGPSGGNTLPPNQPHTRPDPTNEPWPRDVKRPGRDVPGDAGDPA